MINAKINKKKEYKFGRGREIKPKKMKKILENNFQNEDGGPVIFRNSGLILWDIDSNKQKTIWSKDGSIKAIITQSGINFYLTSAFFKGEATDVWGKRTKAFLVWEEVVIGYGHEFRLFHYISTEKIVGNLNELYNIGLL